MRTVERMYVWSFIIAFAMVIPSILLVKFFDELLIYILAGIALYDCVVNGAWRRYKALFIFAGISLFYLLYSLVAVHFNTPAAVIQGIIIDAKPFIPLLVLIPAAPRFNGSDKKIIRTIAMLNSFTCVIALCFYDTFLPYVFYHVAYLGAISLLSAVSYLYVSTLHDGSLLRKDILTAFIMMTIGLGCTRSKFYGEYILFLFLMFAYTPGMLRKLTIGRVVGLCLLGAVIILAAWQKFSYYFLNSTYTSFDFSESDSFARVALYLGMILILIDFPLFGSGFASYATWASSIDAGHYSLIYQRYGLNFVWGLSPEMPDFICDAYYPSLAQFGLIGIGLFIWFWVWAYHRLRVMIRRAPKKLRYSIVISVLIICALFIEMTTGTIFQQPPGEVLSILLGFILGQGQRILDASPKSESDTPLTHPIELNQPKRIY